jgi:hypothetical protein
LVVELRQQLNTLLLLVVVAAVEMMAVAVALVGLELHQDFLWLLVLLLQ